MPPEYSPQRVPPDGARRGQPVSRQGQYGPGPGESDQWRRPPAPGGGCGHGFAPQEPPRYVPGRGASGFPPPPDESRYASGRRPRMPAPDERLSGRMPAARQSAVCALIRALAKCAAFEGLVAAVKLAIAASMMTGHTLAVDGGFWLSSSKTMYVGVCLM